jgi:hypothetical protein
MLGNCWEAERLTASHEGLCSTELVAVNRNQTGWYGYKPEGNKTHNCLCVFPTTRVTDNKVRPGHNFLTCLTNLFLSGIYEGQSKSSGILWHKQFGAPTWTECLLLVICTCKFCRGSGVTRAGRDSGFCITISHRATHRLLCHHPTTALSGSSSEWLLAVPYSKNGGQGDTFRNHGGHQM